MELNKNYIERDLIIFDEEIDWSKSSGGIQSFKIGLDKLEALFVKKFINPKDRQNASPTNKQFFEFMKKHDKYPLIAHGYAVSPRRNDYRVSIEGLLMPERYVDEKIKRIFLTWTHVTGEHKPDSYHDGGDLYCWWDEYMKEYEEKCGNCNGTGFGKPNKNGRRYWFKKCKGTGTLDWLEKIYGKKWKVIKEMENAFLEGRI